MRKKSRKHNARTPQPVSRIRRFGWIGLGAAVLLIAAITIASQPRSSAPADFEPLVTGAPSLALLSDEVINHGDVPVSEFVESAFTVQNVGDKALIFLGDPLIEVVEGCCPPRTSVDQPVLQPGEITTIRTRFTMHEGMGGPHDFRVHVMTNDPQTPERELTILSNWVS